MDHSEFERRCGTTLCNKYKLEKLLGVGGMAAVYRGVHRNGHKVAVKVLHTALSFNAEIRPRFLREGYAANAVDHPGVVRVTDDDVAEDGAVFLVMELLTGDTLEAHIEKSGGTLPPSRIVPLMCQLLEVLSAAHAKGIVHRDIKPDNLFLDTPTGSLKVLDFGIARMEGAHKATRTGGLMGTPVYMSPEQARGQTKLVDGQTDVWAVGAILFRTLTGQYVFDGETPELTMIQVATEQPRRLESVVPSVPRDLCAVVNRALSPTKEARWPTAESMLAALRALDIEDRGSLGLAPTALLAPAITPMSAPPVVGVAPTIDDVPAVRPAFGAELTTGHSVVSDASALPMRPRRTVALVTSVLAAAVVLAVALKFVPTKVEPVKLPSGASSSAPPSVELAAAPATSTLEPLAPLAESVPALAPVPHATKPPMGSVVHTVPRASASAASAASASPLPPVVNCNPNYEIVNGVKRFKKECPL